MSKIRYRVGKRYTYDPNRDARLGIKSIIARVDAQKV